MKRSALAISMLVLLRLALGWHFFDAGIEKLDPGFSSAGFLRGATGPLAPMYRGFVTGPHETTKYLSQPVNANSDDAMASAEQDVEAWLQQVASNWESGVSRVSRLGASDEELAGVETAAASELADLSAFVTDPAQMAALVDLRHEIWRYKKMMRDASDDPAPFLRERLSAKEAETWGGVQPWIQAAKVADNAFTEAAVEVTGASLSADRVRMALKERSRLRRVDTAVTAVILTAGILLFLGLFTPLAALLAAGFLLSAMATQPPWVDGANTTYFYYQLVEVAALATIGFVGAGRWAGLDRLVFGPPMIVAETDPSNEAAA